MSKVILVRHGHTKLNGGQSGEDRIRGWANIPLDEKGIKDAKKVRDEIERKYKIDCIYSSDLSRAFDTAKICNTNDLPITVMMEFRPWNLGVFQGKATKDILEDLNNMVRHEEVEPKGGECFREFRERFLNALQHVIEEAEETGEQAAIFTHFRDLKCADAWIKKGAPRDLSIDVNVMMKDDFAPGAILEIPMEMFKGNQEMDEEE